MRGRVCAAGGVFVQGGLREHLHDFVQLCHGSRDVYCVRCWDLVPGRCGTSSRVLVPRRLRLDSRHLDGLCRVVVHVPHSWMRRGKCVRGRVSAASRLYVQPWLRVHLDDDNRLRRQYDVVYCLRCWLLVRRGRCAATRLRLCSGQCQHHNRGCVVHVCQLGGHLRTRESVRGRCRATEGVHVQRRDGEHLKHNNVVRCLEWHMCDMRCGLLLHWWSRAAGGVPARNVRLHDGAVNRGVLRELHMRGGVFFQQHGVHSVHEYIGNLRAMRVRIHLRGGPRPGCRVHLLRWIVLWGAALRRLRRDLASLHFMPPGELLHRGSRAAHRVPARNVRLHDTTADRGVFRELHMHGGVFLRQHGVHSVRGRELVLRDLRRRDRVRGWLRTGSSVQLRPGVCEHGGREWCRVHRHVVAVHTVWSGGLLWWWPLAASRLYVHGWIRLCVGGIFGVRGHSFDLRHVQCGSLVRRRRSAAAGVFLCCWDRLRLVGLCCALYLLSAGVQRGVVLWRRCGAASCMHMLRGILLVNTSNECLWWFHLSVQCLPCGELLHRWSRAAASVRMSAGQCQLVKHALDMRV